MGDAGRQGSRLSMQRFHHSGTRPLSALLIGDRAHVLARTDPTLAERVADRIWLSTRRGVDLDVLGDLSPVLRAVQGVFRTWRLWRYDVVVVVLGDGQDAPQRPRTLARVGELLQEVLADAAGATDVVVIGPGPQEVRGGRHSSDPGDRVRSAVSGIASDRVRYRAVPVEVDPGARTRSWAAAIGAEVAASLDRQRTAPAAATAAALRAQPQDEAARQAALDGLQVVGSSQDPRLDDLVELARTAFGTECAEINFIDHDRQWKMAAAGGPRGQKPRSDSICTLTIRGSAPLVVGDACLEPELAAMPAMRGPRPIRFYAAHPIESADGFRIGSFCVYDHEPRDVSGIDLSVLRDLALLAQAEIVSHDTAPAGAESRLVPHG